MCERSRSIVFIVTQEELECLQAALVTLLEGRYMGCTDVGQSCYF
jgi:hypothetical protein